MTFAYFEATMDNVLYEYFHDVERNLYVRVGESTFCQPHFHRSLEILYILDGEMETTVGDKSFTATANDIVFAHSYYIHSFKPQPAYHKFVLVIPAEYSREVDKLLSTSTVSPHLDDKEFNKTLLPILQKLNDEQDTMPTLVKKGYLNVILGSLFDHYPTEPIQKNGNIDIMVDVLHYIDNNYSTDIMLDSIADAFGYNKYYFSRLFNKYIGENLTNYINVVRLQNFITQAKGRTETPLSTIAFECGFDSLTTFHRYFNKVYKTTPKQYLSQYRD